MSDSSLNQANSSFIPPMSIPTSIYFRLTSMLSQVVFVPRYTDTVLASCSHNLKHDTARTVLATISTRHGTKTKHNLRVSCFKRLSGHQTVRVWCRNMCTTLTRYLFLHPYVNTDSKQPSWQYLLTFGNLSYRRVFFLHQVIQY